MIHNVEMTCYGVGVLANHDRSDRRAIEFVSSFMGEADYRLRGGPRLRFRWVVCSWDGGKYWNYRTEEEFDHAHNGNLGMLTCGNEPVDEETLETFRRECCASAVTGFYDHFTDCWKQCEPTSLRLSRMAYEASGRCARERADLISNH